MKHFKLKAGSIVKHGTCASKLTSIFEHGLGANGSRSLERGNIEPEPLVKGVYLGFFSAYFGAYAAWCEYAQRVTQNYPKLPLDFYFDIPVVLTIKLKNDLEIYADEDFLADPPPGVDDLDYFTSERLVQEGGRIWKKYKSCAATFVPSSWISRIEVIDMLAPLVHAADPLRIERLKADLYTLAFGVIQVQQRLTFDETFRNWATKVNSPTLTLSMCKEIDDRAEDVLRLNPLSKGENAEAAFLSVFKVYYALSHIGMELGIRTQHTG